MDAKIDDLMDSYASQADYLLDVETTRWGNVYKPANFGRYIVTYYIEVDLYDLKTREAIAEGSLFWKTPKGYDYPTHDELFDNGAAELKAQLKMATDEAIEYLSQNMLGQVI